MSRPVYIRVKDPETKHEWDEPETSPLITKGQVQVVKSERYPPTTTMRPTKYYLPAKGRKPAPAGEGTTTKKENEDG